MIPTLAICSACFLLGLMSDYLFGRHAEPVWRYDLQGESTSSRWSLNQKSLLKELVAKYDLDHNGALEPTERQKISGDDKTRMVRAGMGGSWWASVLYTVTPNWQLFWLADALNADKSEIQWSYVGKAFAYTLGYVGAALALAIAFFEDRELS
jgi:hypothetical protein